MTPFSLASFWNRHVIATDAISFYIEYTLIEVPSRGEVVRESVGMEGKYLVKIKITT